MSRASDTPISTAVVTGGHFYEVVDLHRLLRSLDGIDAYIQHMDDFTLAPREERSSYDVVLFFTMLLEGPRGERLQALEQIGANRQGVVVCCITPSWRSRTRRSGGAGPIYPISATPWTRPNRSPPRSPIRIIRSPPASRTGR